MKKIKLLLGVFIMIMGTLSAQSVKNVNSQEDQANKTIIITYDLSYDDPRQVFDIELVAIIDGISLKPKSLSGDVGEGKVIQGRGKKIIWDVYKDFPNGLQGSAKFKVKANIGHDSDRKGNDTNESRLPKPKPTLAVSVMGLGASSLIAGILQRGNAKNDWDEFYPTATTRTTLDDRYGELNPKYKTGQVLMGLGAAVIVAGVGILVKQQMDYKKASGNRFSLLPDVELGNGVTSGQVGLKMTYSIGK